jgi:membrane fusion protein (multidrug efflux system)
MFLNVALAVATRDNAVVVPEDALVAEGTRQFVYVVADGRALRREVQLGLRMQSEVEIREGVKQGDQLVVRGHQRIRHNIPVRAQPFRAESAPTS